MTDPMSGSAPRCPWCSAALPVPAAERCPSCDAQLVSTRGADADIKGVTSLDAEAILRARSAIARPRSRFLSLITGDEADAASAREHQESLAQPSNEVRREMIRLEAEARNAAIEAERVALQAEAMSQLGIHVGDLPAAEAAQLAGHDAVAAPEAPEAAEVPDAAEAHVAADPPDAADESAGMAGDWPAELHPAEGASAELPAGDDPPA